MTKLLIDHQIFSLQQFGGISRYFSNIIDATKKQQTIAATVGVLHTPNYYLRNYPAPLNNAVGAFLLKKQRKNYKWNQKYSKYLLGKNKHDVFHPSYYDPYFLSYNKKPFVLTVHDMIHERMPEYFNASDTSSKHKRLCIENAAHIIAISEATKQDLQDLLNIEEERITVIHHGFQMNSRNNISQESTAHTTATNYLLYVGDRSGYKNFSRFLTAVSDLLHSEHLKLICAGGGAFKSTEEELMKRLLITDQVSQLNPSDIELSLLYQGASAFVFPSLNEGFGLPILEAFSNNCPVVASNTACFKEVGGDAMAYFDPLDVHEIHTVIKKVILDEHFSRSLIANGSQQLKKYSMEECMEKTLAVYENVAV